MAADSHEPAGAPGAFDAIYEDGVLKPLAPLSLEPGAHVRVQLVPNGAEAAAGSVPLPTPRPLDQPLVAGVLSAFTRQDALLLVFGLAVYALTSFVGIARFPIYFFSDEAVNPLLAQQLLRNGLRDATGTWLPPYFKNDDRWTLSLSVYAQLIGVALFGKSVLVTRGISALISMLCPLAVALALKLVFKARTWWLGALVVAALPAWFLHARTGFETVLAVSFFACFLCAYLLYRCVSPGWLPLALLCGAATFYSYANGQGMMLAVGETYDVVILDRLLPQVDGLAPCQLMERLLLLAARLKPRQLATSKRAPKPKAPKGFVDGGIARSHVATARVIKAGRATP